ncbi:DNA alkylation repair protein [Rhodobacter sp. HX-7-19]|uniref:DNA alkylation repair protein n=1 Tax=Paragemmobacter kunshanensis TaxID=2583234 RepID=A0A6M1TQK3_9RHOB|nr:DNA alkylation repair protein [Rhodobacter kunshanensis]NGQ92549.1 DNA alkylation repair protein [Rhodobacter kunshanensis]
MIAGALARLEALGDAEKAAEMAAYHKIARRYLGVAVPQIEELVAEWRAALSVEERVALAGGLWETGVHEAMVAAAKLLTQARLRPDQAAWEMICGWTEGFEGWAVADHATIAGQKRLVADPARIETVAGWTASGNMWTRRAALVITLPFAKMNFPKEQELAIRERALGWAADFVADRDWFIQKAVAWWLRDLSKHDAARVRVFLEGPGAGLKSFARKEAARYL